MVIDIDTNVAQNNRSTFYNNTCLYYTYRLVLLLYTCCFVLHQCRYQLPWHRTLVLLPPPRRDRLTVIESIIFKFHIQYHPLYILLCSLQRSFVPLTPGFLFRGKTETEVTLVTLLSMFYASIIICQDPVVHQTLRKKFSAF